jgi:hypothetical protein
MGHYESELAGYSTLVGVTTPVKATRDRSNVNEVQDILEKEIAGLFDTVSVLQDRLDRILRPDVPTDAKAVDPGNASPENSQTQNRLWSAVSNTTEIRQRIQRIIDRIDL